MDGRLSTDRFQLIAKVGSGGMGTVWRAWDNRLDREVAVKIIQLYGVSEADRARAYQRTIREAQAAARIRHPGIAAVLDVFVADDGCPWIVMEFVTGRSLDKVIDASGPLPPPVVAAIGIYVLGALAAGHRAAAVHRELKPANIMITPDGKAVLTDFGIATVADNPPLTQLGAFIGTPGFAAPERMCGQSTPAADMWSFGATLYAAVGGRAPYADYPDSAATLFAIMTEEPPALPPSAPLSGLIRALMSRDPAVRPDAARALRAFTEFAASLGPDAAAAAEAWWAAADLGRTPDHAVMGGVNAGGAIPLTGTPPGGPPTERPGMTGTASTWAQPDGARPTGLSRATPSHRARGPRGSRRRAVVVADVVVAAAGLPTDIWAALGGTGRRGHHRRTDSAW